MKLWCCFLKREYQSLYIEDLNLIINFYKPHFNINKVRSINNLFNKIKNNGSFFVKKCIIPPTDMGKWFEIEHSEILELLDCNYYASIGSRYSSFREFLKG